MAIFLRVSWSVLFIFSIFFYFIVTVMSINGKKGDYRGFIKHQNELRKTWFINYCISSNKRRGVYFFTWFLGAAFIGGRRLFHRFQLSRFERETPDFRGQLPISRRREKAPAESYISLEISRYAWYLPIWHVTNVFFWPISLNWAPIDEFVEKKRVHVVRLYVVFFPSCF